ncbi:MAG: hypothetical protein R6X08_11405 [Desulfosalsimonadaceae bacterium]
MMIVFQNKLSNQRGTRSRNESWQQGTVLFEENGSFWVIFLPEIKFEISLLKSQLPASLCMFSFGCDILSGFMGELSQGSEILCYLTGKLSQSHEIQPVFTGKLSLEYETLSGLIGKLSLGCETMTDYLGELSQNSETLSDLTGKLSQ